MRFPRRTLVPPAPPYPLRPRFVADHVACGRERRRSRSRRRSRAQRAPATVQQSGAPASAARTDDTKRAMTVADYAKWRTIRDVAISDDGTWASYGYQQRRVDDTLFVKNLDGAGRVEASACLARRSSPTTRSGSRTSSPSRMRGQRARCRDRDAARTDRRGWSCEIS